MNTTIGKEFNKQKIISKVTIDGVNNYNPMNIANLFNDYFSTIGSKLSDTIHNLMTDPLCALQKIP